MHQKSPGGQPPPAQIARIIHLALIGGVVLFAAVGWLAPGAPPAPDFSLRLLLGPITVAGIAVAWYLRRWLPARHPGETADLWWAAALPKAMAAWALLEATCLVACVTIFLTRDPVALLCLAAGLLIFTLQSPGRLYDSARSMP